MDTKLANNEKVYMPYGVTRRISYDEDRHTWYVAYRVELGENKYGYYQAFHHEPIEEEVRACNIDAYRSFGQCTTWSDDT